MACACANKFDDVWRGDGSTVSSAGRSPASESASNTEVPKSTYASEQPCQSDWASESPKSAFAPQSEGPHLWTILWVHEHCHKTANALWKHELASTAIGFGAQPKCIKKAKNFLQFMEANEPQNYVLVTDWREVKECIAFVSQSRLCQPLLTVILCGSSRQYGRVLRWAEGTNEKDAGPIPVVMEPMAPTHLLSDVVATLLHRSSTPMQFYLGEPPNGRLAESLQAAIGLPSPAMAAMLSIWDSCGSRANLERLLHEAVPACYGD